MDSAFPDGRYGVRIIDPNLEIILLVLRTALKTGWLKAILGKSGPGFIPDDVIREFVYLKERVSEEAVSAFASRLLGKPLSEEMTRIIMKGRLESPHLLYHLKKSLGTLQHKYNRLSALAVWKVYLTRRLIHIRSNVWKRIKTNGRIGKTSSRGGIIIAVIGCDGSGKSSIVRELKEWLSWKNHISCLYLGSGDGDVGFWTRVKRYLDSLVRGVKKPRAIQEAVSKNKSGLRHSFNRILQYLFYVALGKERYGKVIKAYRMKANGRIVLSDRYPQNEFRGIYDGPKIEVSGHDRSYLGILERKESRFYDRIAEFPPDLVIKLNIPIEISRVRKPDEDFSIVRKKIEITPKLQFHGAKIVDIDASGPLHLVIGEVKKAVWNNL